MRAQARHHKGPDSTDKRYRRLTRSVAAAALIGLTTAGHADAQTWSLTEHWGGCTAPQPTVIYHHGSRYAWALPAAIERAFVRRGFHFARVLRWDPAIEPSQRAQRYWSHPEEHPRNGSDSYTPNARGIPRALEKVEEATAQVLRDPRIDPERVVIAGVSNGGVLASLAAKGKPARYQGVVNFVGGWVNAKVRPEGHAVNKWLFRTAAHTDVPPALWLYSEYDELYGRAAERSDLWYEAFDDAGGSARYLRIGTKRMGHNLAGYPRTWTPHLERYLEERGLPHALRRGCHGEAPAKTPTAHDFAGTWRGVWEWGRRKNQGTSTLSLRATGAETLKADYRFKGKRYRWGPVVVRDGILRTGTGKTVRFTADLESDGSLTVTRYVVKGKHAGYSHSARFTRSTEPPDPERGQKPQRKAADADARGR